MLGFELLTSNISSRQVKHQKLNGREHLVAPITMIVPGVLPGSNGPQLYSLEEVSKDPAVWNHMPLVVNHPVVNGKPVSARSPAILNAYCIGMVLNARIKKGRLVADGYFDIENVKRVDERVLNALESGEVMEVSTGLFLDSEPAPEGATFNGKAYTHVAKNYRPDHLAILPEQVGACSIADGCGLLVNEKGEELVANQPSHDDVRMALADLLRERFGEQANVWVVDVFDKEVVYHNSGKLYKVGYMTDLRSDDSVSLDTESAPVEVRRVTKYRPVTNETNSGDAPSPASKKVSNDMAKLTDVERGALINTLTANCSCWSKEDVSVLNGLSDERLKEVVALTTAGQGKTAGTPAAAPPAAPTASPVANAPAAPAIAPAKPKTTDDWMAEAPPEIQSAVRNAMAIEQRQKDSIIARLTANVAAEKRDRLLGRLKAMSLDELTDMELMAPAVNQAPGVGGGVVARPVGNPLYTGAAGAVTNQKPAVSSDEDVLALPTINWAEAVA